MSSRSSSQPPPPLPHSSSSSSSIAPHPQANAFSLTFQSSSRPRQPGIVPAVLRKQGSTVRSASASRSIHTSPPSASSAISASGGNTGVAPYRGNSQSQRHNHERPPSVARFGSSGSLSSSPEEVTRSSSQSRRQQRMASQPSISIPTGGFGSSPTSALTAPSSPIVGTDGVQAKGTALPRSDWQPDSAVLVCQADDCQTRFSAPAASSAHSSSSSSTSSAFGLSALSSINPFTARRHHCRACGRIFCAAHSSSSLPLLVPKDSGLSPRTPVASSSNLFGMLSPAFTNGTNTPANEQPGFNFTSLHNSPTQDSGTSPEGQAVVRKMRVCDLCHLSLSLGSDLLSLSPEYQAQQREREEARMLAQQLAESPSIASEDRRPSYASNSSSSSSARTHGAGQNARLSGIKSTPVSAGHSPHASHALSRSEDRPPAPPSTETASRSARERQESAASAATSATTATSSSVSALSSGIRSDESNEQISGSAQSGKDGQDGDDARSVKTACTTPPHSSSSTTTGLRHNDKQGESRPASAQGQVVGDCIAPGSGAKYRFPDTADSDAEFARTRTVSRAGSPHHNQTQNAGGIGAALHPLDPRHGKEEEGPQGGQREEGANVESSGPAHSLTTLVGSVRDGWTWSTF